jgi:acyl carrier protein
LLHTRSSAEALALCSVKANGGHAQPAAGISGLLRLCVGLRASAAPPNGQLRTINPHVDAALREVACALPTQRSAAPACGARASGGCAGGVSSFGYSGTIVHAVLRSGSNAPSTSSPMPSGLVFNRSRFPWRRATFPEPPGARPLEATDIQPARLIPFEACTEGTATVPHILVGDMSTEDLQAMLLRETAALADNENLTADSPLLESGIDSMAALELRNKIEELTGVRLRNDDLFLDEQTFTVAHLVTSIQRLASGTEPGCDGGARFEATGLRQDYTRDDAAFHTSVALGTAAPVPEKLKRPMLFILSSPRSGSSLLQLCLQANPLLYAGQELYLIMFDTMSERAALPEMRLFGQGLSAVMKELLQVDAATARARVD